VCPKFGKNPVNNVGPREFTRNVFGTDSGGDIKSSSELPASPNIPIGCPVSELAD
jgi:hypothetical protein